MTLRHRLFKIGAIRKKQQANYRNNENKAADVQGHYTRWEASN